jgi:hypothetical protein
MARHTQPATNMRVAATLMGFTALTLAVVSSLHLGGILGRHTKPPFRADDAGIAEAIIGIVLLVGTLAIVRRITQARRFALGATLFAIAGFVVGLTFTLQGGDAPGSALGGVIVGRARR